MFTGDKFKTGANEMEAAAFTEKDSKDSVQTDMFIAQMKLLALEKNFKGRSP